MRSAFVPVLLAVLAAQCVLSMKEKAATFDEPAHLPAGYSYIVTGDFRMNPEHPPLTKLIAGAPLLLLDVKDPRDMKNWDSRDSYMFGNEFLYHSGQDADMILFAGRIPMVVLSLLLGLLVYAWAREMSGPGAGAFALFLYSFCPTVVAHSTVVTPDIGASLFIALSVYCMWRYMKRPDASRLIAAGITLGLALLSKFNALALVPLFGCLLLMRPGSGGLVRKVRSACIVLFASCLVASIVIWAGYLFECGPILVHRQHSAAGLITRSMPKGLASLFISFLEKTPVPFPSYFKGLGWAMVPTMVGRDSFLMGSITRRCPWYGNIFSIIIKTPLPFWVFICAGLAQVCVKRLYRNADHIPLLMAIFAIFAVDSLSRFSIGVKYVLPSYPFLCLLAATPFDWRTLGRRADRAAFLGLCLWYMVSAVRIFPHDLAYFNELVGGPENGYRYLVDSNLDWGQDLKLLARYVDTHNIGEIKLAYFGTADPAYHKLRYRVLEPFKKEAGWIAVSATLLQGAHTARCSYDWLARYEPVAKIGYSIFVYDIKETGGLTGAPQTAE